ncbi:acetylglutamate kinase [Candidatus Magnetobacterium casense]|uniref:Acetylglutamate kinase n=1 Tax=Candidatus Magnetobacterium casense TaxID=1455061 RepID=A0ABS6RYZ4_9BACT|nr:acetylglutamate kinase [Candidatus Magnetobacterium casensis]MBV6341848.1 acetylglutamate kinase [Candidatus Magnetobacterium casensis]
MEDLVAKAEILIEALPYIRNFYKKTFVIKYGGSAQSRDDLKDLFAGDIVLFNYVGINTVIVHGGGPQITTMMQRFGKQPVFVDGHRVTDRETMQIVEMVLGGSINKEIVSLINRHGGKAVGLTGRDASFIKARKKTGGADLGLVGEVEAVDVSILTALISGGFIPVVAPIGTGSDTEALNINADLVAAAIASTLEAEKLILLTDVPGIIDKDGATISTLRADDFQGLAAEGTIKGGMLPKVQACLQGLNSKVTKTHIIDGRNPHCLLLEIFTQKGVGTEIVL